MLYTDISIVQCPLELGCGKAGTALGPRALASSIAFSATVAFAPVTERREKEKSPKYLREVVDANIAIRDAVASVHEQKQFPLILGGDHSIGLGSVAGTGVHYSADELSLVWVDAHTDINTEDSSATGNIHGMPIAALLGLCKEELSSVCPHLPVLKPENVHIFFARSIDPMEEDIIKETGVNVYRMAHIREIGLDAAINEMLSNIKTPYSHVSWDVDCLDSAVFKSTGLPVPNGPYPMDVKKVLFALIRNTNVVALDCVEYNPLFDPSSRGRTIVLSVLQPVLDEIQGK